MHHKRWTFCSKVLRLMYNVCNVHKWSVFLRLQLHVHMYCRNMNRTVLWCIIHLIIGLFVLKLSKLSSVFFFVTIALCDSLMILYDFCQERLTYQSVYCLHLNICETQKSFCWNLWILLRNIFSKLSTFYIHTKQVAVILISKQYFFLLFRTMWNGVSLRAEHKLQIQGDSEIGCNILGTCSTTENKAETSYKHGS
jgi:hypothetical protein